MPDIVWVNPKWYAHLVYSVVTRTPVTSSRRFLFCSVLSQTNNSSVTPLLSTSILLDDRCRIEYGILRRTVCQKPAVFPTTEIIGLADHI